MMSRKRNLFCLHAVCEDSWPMPGLSWCLSLLLLIAAQSAPAQEKPAPPPSAAPAAAPEAAPAEPALPAPKKQDPTATTLGVPNQVKTGSLPANTSGLSELASQAFARKDWDSARKYYEEMLREDPLNAL